MKTHLYLECSGGISGDMTVAALLSLGGSAEKLNAVLASLKLEDLHWEITQKRSYGIAGTDFNVILPHEHHHHEHRNMADVTAIIERSTLTPRSKSLALKIFAIIAEAEAKAHGIPVDQVHFHEVGALDSIADVIAVSVLADDLDITDCVITGLSEGTGTVHCAHGDLPVPVPAVVNIAEKYSIPLHITENSGEMVTPTGIAIAAALRTSNVLPESFTIRKIGIGLGKRDFGHPNMLRALLIGSAAVPGSIWKIECNIDDSTGEMLSTAMESLFKAGALDVHYIPCFMKKNRPAWQLTVLADESKRMEIERTLFRTTSTIGVRRVRMERTCMERSFFDVELSIGKIRIKHCTFDGIVRNYPEYESVSAAAERSGLSVPEIYAMAKHEADSKS